MTTLASTLDGDAVTDFENRTYARVTWRLIPFLFLCYVVAYLDRVNVGFAKLQMLNSLQWSDSIYGLGAGLFFVGYFLFEVPSNLLLYRYGARRWIARIMISWAILSGLTAFVTTPTTFYVLRFLLGVAEAGFFPGIILYLTYWYPAHRRGRITALFMTAIPISGVVGGPLSGWILGSFGSADGWAGWQWLFMLEALPSLLVGVMVLYYLDDGIASARWLDDRQKALLQDNIRTDAAGKQDHSIGAAFSNGKVWIMCAIYFSCAMGNYGISFWLPSLIQAAGIKSLLSVGLLSAIPFAVGAISMVLFARSADRQLERRWHLAVALLIGAVGLSLSALFGQQAFLAIAALSFASAGIMSLAPLFWSLPTAFLGGAAAATGIALINSVANLAGFVSPFLIGWIKDQTHSTAIGLYLLSGVLVAGAALVIGAVPARLVNR
ncbi:MFS transporter [Herbaspirillum sp. BH-1]|uniref:D-galactonate transporter n=1 Tax=Herbaspirillum frisingense TaxID=92645 RepID=A0ABU1PB10_9BURK|nr:MULTISPECIES: MFS transporter [Herbaspirillum]MDR6582930.1 D-galactonate transporter [Herbaspirillum frisingense]PLY60490.1 MFS transporter [Herbaspirillum sp. BH-1]